MENLNIKGYCKLETCPVSNGGNCLEGYPKPESCPNYVIKEGMLHKEDTNKEYIRGSGVQVSTPATDSQDILRTNSYENLYDGEGLNSELASKITSKYLTRFIMVAGLNNSGKTTLLSSLYEKFQMDSFAGYMFAGSRTLRAWEQRCHLARIESGRTTPDTERTKLADNTLLHLAVRKENNTEPTRNIIFTDLAGERFRLAKDSIEECQKLFLLKRVDHFVLLIDGNKLVNLRERNNATTDPRVLLRSCLDSQMLGSDTLVEVVFTKWDLVEKYNQMNNNELVGFISTVENRFKLDLEQRVKQLNFFRIAARPNINELPFGYNLDKLFPKWVEELPSRIFYIPAKSEKEGYAREIDKYTFILDQ